MRRSVLIVMLDVMVLSVLSLTLGNGDSRFIVPVYRWSSLIERGLEKEQEYEQQLAELRSRAQQQAEALAEAAARQAELQRQKAGLTAEAETARAEILQARTAAEAAKEAARQAIEAEKLARVQAEAETRARAEAEKRAQAAVEQSIQAEAAARAAKELQARADAAAQAAQAAKKQAEAEAARVEAEAAQLQLQTRLAEERAAQARENIAELKQKTEQSTTQLLEMQAELKQAEKQLESSTEAAALARQREQEALEKTAQAARKEQAAIEKMQRLEADRKRALERLQQMDDRLTATQLAEEQAVQALTEARKQAEAARTRLDQIEAEKNQSVWVVRERAIRRFQVAAREESKDPFPNRTTATLYLPLVEFGEQLYAISEFESLRLDWWGIQRAGDLLSFVLNMDHVQAGTLPHQVTEPLLIHTTEPRTVYIPVPRGAEETGLRPIGLKRIKEERIQTGLLFKKEVPDTGLTVEFTPSLDAEGYLLVRTAEAASKVKIEAGDYILTQNGFLVGVMMTRTLCYVIPEHLPAPELRATVTLTKKSGQRYFETLVEDARAVSERIRELPENLRTGSGFSWPSF
jgi:hypothetical protein